VLRGLSRPWRKLMLAKLFLGDAHVLRAQQLGLRGEERLHAAEGGIF
jgi:hypothetical protein